MVGLKKQRRHYLVKNEGYMAVVFTLIAGTVWWFFTSPNIRFGIAFIIINGIMALTFIIRRALFLFNDKAVKILIAGLLIFSFLPFYDIFFIKIAPHNFVRRNYLIKPSGLLPANGVLPGYLKIKVNRVDIFYPEYGDLCWNAPLPCTPYPNHKLILRTDNLKDGFKALSNDTR